MTYTDPETLYAWCHMFNIGYRCVHAQESDRASGRCARINIWIHQLYVYNPDTGFLVRQETVEGLEEDTWKNAIGRLISAPPQSLW